MKKFIAFLVKIYEGLIGMAFRGARGAGGVGHAAGRAVMQPSAQLQAACAKILPAPIPRVTIVAPSTAVHGTAFSVHGTVVPTGDVVNVNLTTGNTIAPMTGWTATTNTNGNYTGSLTASAAGTYYAWAQDPISGYVTVSGAITVS